jgi:hypothetical protein
MKQVSNNGTLSKRMRPATKRKQSGRRIMHIAQVITPHLTKAAARTSSKAADKAD